MNEMLNCPICNQEADWYQRITEKNIKVFFCESCLEHFTEEDTVDSMKSRILSDDNIIDEMFIAFKNTTKSIKNLTKNEPLDCE